MSTLFCEWRIRLIDAEGDNTDPWIVPVSVSFGGTLGEPERCTVVIGAETHIMSNEESGDGHVTLLRSRLEVYEITDPADLANTLPPPWLDLDPIWQGDVFFKPVRFSPEPGGAPLLAITALSKMHALHGALALIDGDSLGARETPLKLMRSVTGTATGASSVTVLVDSGALFETAHITPGMMVLNSTKAAPTWVETVDSETQVTTVGLGGGADFDAGDDYIFQQSPVTLIQIENGTGGTALPPYAWFPEAVTGGPEYEAFETTAFTDVDTEVGATAGAADTEIQATATHGGFTGTGFLKIGTEVIHHDGYDFEDTDADTIPDAYVFKHCRRGAFGTTAAIHLAAAPIAQLKPYVIGPRAGIILEKRIAVGEANEGVWIPMGEGEYVVHAQRGFFEMTYDVLAGGGSQEGTFDAIRARYAVYDAEHADAVNIGNEVALMLQESASLGAPGWSSGTDYDVDALLSGVVMPRHTLRTPASAYEAIQDLLAEAGLSTGSGAATDAVSMVDRHSDGKLLIGFVQQKADDVAADTAIGSTVDATWEYSLDTIYTAVNVLYAPTGGVRLAVPGRTWHPQPAQDPENPTEEETFLTMGNAHTFYCSKIVKQEIEQAPFGTWDDDYTDQEGDAQSGSDNRSTAAGHRQWVDKLFDGLGQTGWGIVGPPFEALDVRQGHVGPCDVLVGWHYVPGVPDTPETPTTAVVEQARLIADMRLTNEAFGPAHVQLVGIPSMTVENDVPDYDFDSCVPLGLEAAFSRTYPIRQSGYRALGGFGAVEMQFAGIDVPLQGWALRFIGAPIRNIDGENWRYMTAKHLEVLGRPRETAYVQLTGTPGGDATQFYLPDTYARLRGTITGVPRVLTVDIGTASRQEAIAMGRILLAQSLAHLGDMRITAKDCLGPLPLCGLHTVNWIDALNWTAPETLTVVPRRGIALEREISWDAANGKTITLVLRNYRITSQDLLH